MSLVRKVEGVMRGIKSTLFRSHLQDRGETRPEHDEEIRVNKAEQMRALKKLAREAGDEETQAYAAGREQAIERLSKEYDVLRRHKPKED